MTLPFRKRLWPALQLVILLAPHLLAAPAGIRAAASPEVIPGFWQAALRAPTEALVLNFFALAGWSGGGDGQEAGGSGAILIEASRHGPSVAYLVRTEDWDILVERNGARGSIRSRPRLGAWETLNPARQRLTPELEPWWNEAGQPGSWGHLISLSWVRHWVSREGGDPGRKSIIFTLEPEDLATALGGHNQGSWLGRAEIQLEPTPKIVWLYLEFTPPAAQGPPSWAVFRFSYPEP